jgi:hypothetical protein
MLIPIFWTQKTKIRNLEKLLADYRQYGGSIIQYDRIFPLYAALSEI